MGVGPYPFSASFNGQARVEDLFLVSLQPCTLTLHSILFYQIKLCDGIKNYFLINLPKGSVHMELKLTASAIKDWFQYRCERKVIYQTMRRDLREAVPIEEENISSAWAKYGNEFEEEVIRHLSRQYPGQVLRPTQNDILSPRKSRLFLTRGRKERFACQLPVASGSERLCEMLELPSEVTLSRMTRPDIVEVIEDDEGAVFHIIDVKATRRPTQFHKAQVAFYALVLGALLKEQGIVGRIDTQGSIWCLPESGDSSEPYRKERFGLKAYTELVMNFFRRELPRMVSRKVSAGSDDTFYHVYFKCEQCKYLPHCSKSLPPHRSGHQSDLSAIGGMSHQAKRSLHELGIRQVGQLVDQDVLVKQQGQSWALRARHSQYVQRAKAILEDKIFRLEERHTWLMPPRTDVGIYIVADRDPVDGELVALGCAVYDDDALTTQCLKVVTQSGREHELSALLEVLGHVVQALSRVDQANADGAQLIAHLFVYEPAEAIDIQEALGRHLEERDIRTALLDLVRIFPPDEIRPEPEYKGVQHLPACSLRSVVEQLYALPVTVAFDLSSVSQILGRAPAPLSMPYEPEEAFKRPFSSRLSLEIFRDLRRGALAHEAWVPRIENDVASRLAAMHGLRRWIEADNARVERPFLRLNKAPFRFQSTFDPLGASQLDALLAHEILGNRVGKLERLIELARPAYERRDRFNCYAELEWAHKQWEAGWAHCLVFRVPDESLDTELGAGSFGLILTDNNPDILLDPTMWPFYGVTLEPPGPGYSKHSLLVKMNKKVFNSPPFSDLWSSNQKGLWYIDLSYLDLNTDRIARFLKFLATEAPVGGEEA